MASGDAAAKGDLVRRIDQVNISVGTKDAYLDRLFSVSAGLQLSATTKVNFELKINADGSSQDYIEIWVRIM